MPLRLRLVQFEQGISHVEQNEATCGNALAQAFVEFAVSAGVLKFGEFKTKAGRIEPIFFQCRAVR